MGIVATLLWVTTQVSAQSVSDNLRYINQQFDRYNAYESSLDVQNGKLVFQNKFGPAYIDFKDIGFRINYKFNSIDIYCLDGSKCIKKGDSDWDYYNISMIENGTIAEDVIFETLDRIRAIKKYYVSSEKYVYYGNSEDDLLRYINRQFDRYNKYYARFEVEDDKLVFSNKFGTAKIPFREINFKINTNTKSVEVHCNDGSKCIQKYDFDGSVTGWDFYNVSLVEEDGSMSNVAYTVKEKCDKLLALHNGGGNVDNRPSFDPNAYDESTIDGLLAGINAAFDRYNTYESKFSVDRYNKTLNFENNMSPADPLRFSDIGFRVTESRNSIDIYCKDGSKCIQKGGSSWDYYNVSLVDGDDMYNGIYDILRKCEKLQNMILRGSNDGGGGRNNNGGGGNTGSTEDYRDK